MTPEQDNYYSLELRSIWKEFKEELALVYRYQDRADEARSEEYSLYDHATDGADKRSVDLAARFTFMLERALKLGYEVDLKEISNNESG